jgi:hypothetical protein
MAAFATATVLMLTYRRCGWQALALGAAGLISLSRVYLGVHYPSDILGGAMLGAGVGATSYGLVVARQAGQIQWGWLLWLQVALVGLITEMAYLAILPWNLLAWPLADKVLHFTLFGMVVFWLNLWLEGKKIRLGTWLIPLAILLPLLIASTEEVTQAWSPVRTASISDWLSDLSGMLFFWWLSTKVMEAKLNKRRIFAPIYDFRF